MQRARLRLLEVGASDLSRVVSIRFTGPACRPGILLDRWHPGSILVAIAFTVWLAVRGDDWWTSVVLSMSKVNADLQWYVHKTDAYHGIPRDFSAALTIEYLTHSRFAEMRVCAMASIVSSFVRAD